MSRAEPWRPARRPRRSEMFIGMGVEDFAGRAERELLATGERARKRTVETREDLTAQEAQIARLAHDGLSNPEIGGRLFISPRTVEYHLHKVFAKLNIRSRVELDRVLAPEPAAAVIARSQRQSRLPQADRPRLRRCGWRITALSVTRPGSIIWACPVQY